jgi:heme A synthase
LAVAGSVLVAVFPTDPGESVSLSAQIHRYAAGVVFFCVPIAALLVASRLRDIGRMPRYRTCLQASVIFTGIVLAVFLASQSAMAPESLYGTLGLWQRVLFVAELSLLAQLAFLITRGTASQTGSG